MGRRRWRVDGIVVAMRMLPYERFTIESPLTIDEVRQRLRKGVAPVKLSLRLPAQPFRGQVRGDMFVIHRAIGYRNSFRPEVTGRVAPGSSGSTIEVTMKLHPVVTVFMSIWLSLAALAFVGFGIAVLFNATLTSKIPGRRVPGPVAEYRSIAAARSRSKSEVDT